MFNVIIMIQTTQSCNGYNTYTIISTINQFNLTVVCQKKGRDRKSDITILFFLQRPVLSTSLALHTVLCQKGPRPKSDHNFYFFFRGLYYINQFNLGTNTKTHLKFSFFFGGPWIYLDQISPKWGYMYLSLHK